MNASAIVGLVVMIVTQAATLADVEPFATWNTPIAWTGFILFADGIVWRSRGDSWIRSAPREFAFLVLVSIPLWLVFEFFNLFIDNWHYVGLPEDRWLRYFGYAWSFATIWPAIFEGADLISVWRGRLNLRARSAPFFPSGAGAPPPARTDADASPRVSMAAAQHGRTRSRAVLPALSIALGAALLAWPLATPSQYLAAPVWLGFIFLLDPINARLGEESLAAAFRAGEHSRFTNLILSGFLCGILWELWNYWAHAKWHYTVPIMADMKIFEMPLPGYFGFPAFALECFTMYVFVRAIGLRLAPAWGRAIFRRSSAFGPAPLGRTIAL